MAEDRLAALADRVVSGDATAFERADVSRLELLRWLAEHRPVVFHGSGRGDLNVLEPIRLSSDVTPFGNQEAVFASDDPAWAMWFAILRRGDGFSSTRNGSIGIAGRSPSSRRYFFSVNDGALTAQRFGPGFLYVLPRDSFQREPPMLGVLDSAQWASPQAVRPLVRLSVDPDDFPFLDRVVTHHAREPVFATILRASARELRTKARTWRSGGARSAAQPRG